MSDTTATPCSARDSHLFGPGPKRILAIDGGGVRGIVALEFLERIESELSERAGKPTLLCDHFDLVGGTSTGAIIATGLALGLSVAEIRAAYLELAPLAPARAKTAPTAKVANSASAAARRNRASNRWNRRCALAW